MLRIVVLALLAPMLLLLPATPASAIDCEEPRRGFRVGTHNVLHGKARFTRFASVIGWQEVTDRADRRKLKRQLGPRFHHFIPRTDDAAAIPVSWRARDFSFITSRSIKVHEGRYKVTPSRWINVVHLRQRVSGRRVIIINTHFIAGAFKRGESYPLWRLVRWHEHRTALYKAINQVRNRRPHALVVVSGDFNRNGYLSFRHQRLKPLRLGPGSHPIDHQYVGMAGTGDCVQRFSKAGSDHYRRRALVWFR